MTQRRIFIGTLALAVAAAACGREAAGPAVDQTMTGNIFVSVLTDTGNAATPTYSGRSGVTVLVYPEGDSVFVRRASTGTGGALTIRGLPVGTYVVKPAVRPFTTFASPESTVVEVEWGVTDSSSVFRFRQGGRIAGFIGVSFLTDSGPIVRRFGAGKSVKLLREVAPGTYEEVATTTTDAGGNYEFVAPPFTEPLAITFESGEEGIFDQLVFVSSRVPADTVQTITQEEVRFRGFTTGATGLGGGNVTQNLLFGLQSTIAGRVWRDLNRNAVYDGAGENLITGDSITFQLRSEDNARVVATTRATATAANLPGYGAGTQGFVFTNVAPGTYNIVAVPALSRFAATPGFTFRADTITVTVTDTHQRQVAPYPITPVP